MRLRLLVLCLVLINTLVVAKPVQDFLPKNQNYLAGITTPEQVLGFELGHHHARHHQLQQFFTRLAEQSERVKFTNIGQSYQRRDQFILTISSADNIKQLTHLLANRKPPFKKPIVEPLVIWLGYSVHGDELTGAQAAMAVAYHLAASQSPDVINLLNEAVIVLEPSLNPDGMDRYVSWLDTFSTEVPNADPAHIEHQQGWPSGRTNHYWFDLNRDWLMLTQQESQNRLAIYHQYQPHVLADYHEMDVNKSYFFQPGIVSRTHPLTPQKNIELTHRLASAHAAALDKSKRLYFSQEGYDDFYYGKGSTYPDINAGVGILFEQAGSRGLIHQTQTGVLTFTKGIENNVITSLSTLNGALANKTALKQHRFDFYQQVANLVDDEEFDGYLLHEAHDKYRLNLLLSTLQQHQIKVYALAKDFKHNDQVFSKAASFYVPLNQPQYRVIKALFNQQKQFQENRFYDISGWTLPLAMNISFYPIEKSRNLKLAGEFDINSADKIAITEQFQTSEPTAEPYAYVFQWHHSLAPKLLYRLLSSNIATKVATTGFTAELNKSVKTFSAGSIVVPAAIQTSANWQSVLTEAAASSEIKIFPLTTGLTASGADIGSPSMVNLRQPKILLIGGQGVSESEAGEVMYYLDHTLNIPVTLVEMSRLPAIKLATYTHLILVDGDYTGLPETQVKQVQSYLIDGGIIYAQKNAANWLADQRLLKARFATQHSIDNMYLDDMSSFQDKAEFHAKREISGAIFESQLDLSHPLTLGFNKANLPLFKNSTAIIEKVNLPFATVAKYSPTPLLSGFTDDLLVNRIAGQAAIVAHEFGQGKIIATGDNLLFRGYWLGSAKIFVNSLFFADLISTN
ncbi:MAG: M14 family zinc carboxypeptidase [Thalassotalea sp.]